MASSEKRALKNTALNDISKIIKSETTAEKA